MYWVIVWDSINPPATNVEYKTGKIFQFFSVRKSSNESALLIEKPHVIYNPEPAINNSSPCGPAGSRKYKDLGVLECGPL